MWRFFKLIHSLHLLAESIVGVHVAFEVNKGLQQVAETTQRLNIVSALGRKRPGKLFHALPTFHGFLLSKVGSGRVQVRKMSVVEMESTDKGVGAEKVHDCTESSIVLNPIDLVRFSLKIDRQSVVPFYEEGKGTMITLVDLSKDLTMSLAL